MNTTFNLKRFFLLEKYKKQETGKHLLWSAGVVLGICILCMMYDINKGMSYYTEHTQANYFCSLFMIRVHFRNQGERAWNDHGRSNALKSAKNNQRPH